MSVGAFVKTTGNCPTFHFPQKEDINVNSSRAGILSVLLTAAFSECGTVPCT